MFIDPKEVIAQLPLSGTEIAIDLGAGSGVYTLELAKILADGGGKVYAVDVQQDMLTRLAHTVSDEHLSNVAFVHADIEQQGGVHLADGMADLVVISNTLYCTEHRDVVLLEAARLLRPRGHLLLIDWSGPYKGMGPEAAQVVSKQLGAELAKKAGFDVQLELSGGDHHWVLLCVHSPSSGASKRFAV
ncbi:MAG TPA: class I SAM-dependent methyltransferase [Candidatus Paceibacterota bacterium]|nr:class I SAM-dependent methyltransferase [Candidatus Paceibacterota bacterium]